ncbi:MAG TPA: hypothetical protein VFS54_11395 [Solirubrobacterales bacterium]|nr:hypothetical protein [Solirubrobacterales bacterium]
MKYVKILGLLAVAAAALMAFAGTAMATSVTTTTGGAAATPTIHAVNEGGHVVLANSIANIECASTSEGKVETHGAGVPASGKLSSLSFTGCTNSWHVTVTAPGTLSVTWSSGHNGTAVSNEAKVTTTRLGVTCNYETKNTAIGTVTGGATATLDISASIPIAAGSSGLCGSGNAKWSGSYVTTSALYVAP